MSQRLTLTDNYLLSLLIPTPTNKTKHYHIGKMAKIPDNILETLICSECSCYLSYGPIRLKIEGGAVCGRCLLPDNSFVSDTPYENLAKMMYFPCRYKKYGCEHQEKFGEVKTHEENCEFKEYRCPVVTDGSCQWLGSIKQALEHVENNHNDTVLTHPCVLPHMFPVKNQANVYLTSTSGFLFLIHSETSVVSRKMHHWVKILASNEYAKHFEFKLNIKSTSTKITDKKGVTPYSSSDLEVNTLVTSLLGLQEIFNKLDDLKIILSIHTIFDNYKCCSCQIFIKKFVYQSSGKYKCEKCLPQVKNCTQCYGAYQDIETKQNKHLQYFCNQVTSCQNCESSNGSNFSYNRVSRGSYTLLDHIQHYHSDCYHTSNIFKTSIPNLSPNAQFVFTTVRTPSLKKIHAITAPTVGIILCEVYKHKDTSNSNWALYFNIYSPLTSKVLNNYDCHLEIFRPETNFTLKRFLNRENGLDADWSLKEENCDLSGEVQINITFSNRDISKHPQLVR